MTFSKIQNTFVAGEISPELYGRTELEKFSEGAFTMRNFFVSYRGGALSRPGGKYCGAPCKQSADGLPPRDINFQFNNNQGYALEFGDMYMRIKSNGEYVVEDGQNIEGISTAASAVVTITGHGYSNGDWLYITGVKGISGINGLAWIVTNSTTDTFELEDMYGNALSTLFQTYTSGGVAERIYTVDSPYAVEDLPYLKYTQSADTMTLTCVNQDTGTEYDPYELVRNGATNWAFTAITFASSISAPTGVSVANSSSASLIMYYSYVVTAVNDAGDESVASTQASVHSCDIAINAGSNTVTWTASSGAVSYNIYRATPVYAGSDPFPISGVLYGFVGSSTGLTFVETNITPDFTKVPPTHKDPFSGTGNKPGAVAYFQQRRVYAGTTNAPDTYFMSQPGSYTNMDSSIPVSDNDAITGTPWAQQINGIQFMVPMPGGLIVLTGGGAWQVSGGTNNAAITPSNQSAVAQAYNGCHNRVGPVVINNDILYVQSKGSIVRDLSYNLFTNIYTGTDKTVLSSHLFNYYQIVQWAYAEEPFKVVWAVRNDGTMLSLTYLKEQDVYGWARHDTNGFYVSVCSVTEPPVDAIYLIAKRYINGKWFYYPERFDNRNWTTPENSFCVDAGLSLAQTYPNATLTPASATGTSNISSVTVAYGGSNYTSPTVTAVDSSGTGTGATFSTTVSGGVITAITPVDQGAGYTPGLTTLVITDSTGSGAVASPVITNIVSFTASSGVFTSDNVGDVIRIGNNNAPIYTESAIGLNGYGKAVITSYVSSTEVMADIIEPITAVIPDNPDNMPVPAIANQWSVSTPVTTISALNHLEGEAVAVVADGAVIEGLTVQNGQITLPEAASAVTVGLPFTCQLQSAYLDVPSQSGTVQGKRKIVPNVVLRLVNSRGLSVGTNQPDQSASPTNANIPWTGLVEVKERDALVPAGTPLPLLTGDYYVNIETEWDVRGQVAIQQDYPLPANIMAVVCNFDIGDTSG